MIALKPVRPPIALERAYHRKIRKLLREMNESLYDNLRQVYREIEPQVVGDGALGDVQTRIRRLVAEWEKRFDDEAYFLAEWFGNQSREYVARNLQQQMRKSKLAQAGFDLKFSYMSQREKDAFGAIVAENVNLIKSIASQHLTNVTGVVLRGIETGHDLSTVTKSLKESFGVSERRAAMIARDQTNKSTSNLSRARLLVYGVEKGKWMHTSAGKTYRHSHVEMDGEIYDLNRGCYDPDYGGYIQPAELVNCHCVCIPIVDFSGEKVEDRAMDFNENHDPDNGQFTSEGGSTSGGSNAKIEVSPTGVNKFKVRGFKNKQKLMNHWKNGRSHGEEFPEFSTAKEYEQAALKLIEMPVGGNVLGHADAHGNVIRYDKDTNIFVKGDPQKGIRTMYRPPDEEKYYISQREEDMKYGGKS